MTRRAIFSITIDKDFVSVNEVIKNGTEFDAEGNITKEKTQMSEWKEKKYKKYKRIYEGNTEE